MQSTIDYEQLVAAIGDAIIISDTEGNITLRNDEVERLAHRLFLGKAERMFGFTEEEAMGKSLDLIIPQRDVSFGVRNNDRVADGGHELLVIDGRLHGAIRVSKNVAGFVARNARLGAARTRS